MHIPICYVSHIKSFQYITTFWSPFKFNSSIISINIPFRYLAVINELLTAFKFSTNHHELIMFILECTLLCPFHLPMSVVQQTSERRKYKIKPRACAQKYNFRKQSIWSRLLAFVMFCLTGWIHSEIVTYLLQFCAMIYHSEVNKFTRGEISTSASSRKM